MAKLFRLTVAFVAILTAACQKKEVILEDLSQKDANEVVVLLRHFSIDAEKVTLKERKSTSCKITVGAHQAQDALRILVENQLPKNKSLSFKDVYPPGSAGMIPTKSDEKARLFMALQGEIEAMIKLLPSIADARVVLAMDRDQPLGKEAPKKGASVLIVYYPQEGLEGSPLSDEEIKALVSSSLSDLAPSDVTVLQKPLAPAAYIGAVPALSRAPDESDARKNLVWASLCLIGITLFTAAYTLARPHLKRRARSSP